MTLIVVRDGNGKITGRCDERCYNAKKPVCKCICGGKNHGCGLDKAVENMNGKFKDEIENGNGDSSIEFPLICNDLFGGFYSENEIKKNNNL